MTVSIIVPIYNSRDYLSQCIDSILNQSYSDFELLLIDDGSTDDSRTICDGYEAKDNRIRTYHKENGGVSSARNKGLDEAKGDYIVFIDADDYVNPGYIEHLMNSDSDLAITGIKRFNARNDSFLPLSTSSFTINDLPSHWNTIPEVSIIYNFTVAKRFRTSIIREHGIRFDEDLFFSEDMLFNMEYMSHSESFYESPVIDYMYRIESISRHQKFRMSAKELVIHFDRINGGISELEKITGINTLPNVRDNVNLRLLRKFFYYLLNCKDTSAFVENIETFRDQDWADYMLHLLQGKREKRIMNRAIHTPHLVYYTEIVLRSLLNK